MLIPTNTQQRVIYSKSRYEVVNGFVAMREEQFARLVAALAEVHIERSGQKILTGILIYDGLYRIP